MRRYCGRVGAAGDMGDPCAECGASHDPLPEELQGKCASYVTCAKDERHGHPCLLSLGHAGRCSADDCLELGA